MELPKIEAVVCHDEEFGIGKDGGIPWDLPWERGLFKQLTEGHNGLIMGRKTFDTMSHVNWGQREPIVLSRRDMPQEQTLDDILGSLREINEGAKYDRIIVIGGQQIYELFKPVIEIVHRTIVPGKHGCDTFFPIRPSALLWQVNGVAKIFREERA